MLALQPISMMTVMKMIMIRCLLLAFVTTLLKMSMMTMSTMLLPLLPRAVVAEGGIQTRALTGRISRPSIAGGTITHLAARVRKWKCYQTGLTVRAGRWTGMGGHLGGGLVGERRWLRSLLGILGMWFQGRRPGKICLLGWSKVRVVEAWERRARREARRVLREEDGEGGEGMGTGMKIVDVSLAVVGMSGFLLDLHHGLWSWIRLRMDNDNDTTL
jgi:hypothetical protein